MSSARYRTELQRARTMAEHTQNPEDNAYWIGYARGVRRAWHGEQFGTKGEHTATLALVGDVDPLRDARGRGYRDGLDCTDG